MRKVARIAEQALTIVLCVACILCGWLLLPVLWIAHQYGKEDAQESFKAYEAALDKEEQKHAD